MTVQVINFNIYNRSTGEQNEMNNGLNAISQEFDGKNITNINFGYKTKDVPGTVYLNGDICKEEARVEYGKQEGNDLVINLNCAGASLLNEENAQAQIGRYNENIIKYDESRYDTDKYNARQEPAPPYKPLIKNVDHTKRIENNLNFLATELSKIIGNTHARKIKINLLVCKSDEFAEKLQKRLTTGDSKKLQINGYRFVYDVNGEYFISYPNTLKGYLNEEGRFSQQQIKNLDLEKYKISLANNSHEKTGFIGY